MGWQRVMNAAGFCFSEDAEKAGYSEPTFRSETATAPFINEQQASGR
jgi:hypothetical protein